MDCLMIILKKDIKLQMFYKINGFKINSAQNKKRLKNILILNKTEKNILNIFLKLS